MARRGHIAAQLEKLPDEAFTRLQYLQVQVGCFNRCAFCSQEAGSDIWQLSAVGLADLFAAIRAVILRRGIPLGGERVHRPRVLFPYLDNDVASYAHLGPLVRYCGRDLHVRLRISTVGYSRRNERLAETHHQIVAEHGEVIDGIRFSLTPYAVGYRTNRDEYIADLAAALSTWRPYVERVGASAATAAVELRFAPLIRAVDGPLYDEIVDGHHIVALPPHLLVSTRKVTSRPMPTTIVGVMQREASFSRAGEPYKHLVSDRLLENAVPAETARLVLEGVVGRAENVRSVTVHAWTNADGYYYAVDPMFTPHGYYKALHLYARTDRRRRAGYTDATRFFLNALLTQKEACGIGRRDAFPDATRADIRAVLNGLAARAAQTVDVDRRAAEHVLREVLPLVETYAAVLEQAGYPPSAFFDRNFTIDTGQIVNQGKAIALFRGLATTVDEPMTPREERGYGRISLSSQRGNVWRIAPAPTETGRATRIGGKNTAEARPTLVVEELDPQHLRPVNRDTGQPLRRYLLDGVETETLGFGDADMLHSMPGISV